MTSCLGTRTRHKIFSRQISSLWSASVLHVSRMQLVVMAALLAMTVGGQGCRFVCRPVNFTINATVCDKHRSIVTTICEGQCFQMDPIYKLYRPQQKTCNGDWSYETKHFEDCPVGFSYPVARSCKCAMCQGGNTQCEMFLDEVPTCHPLANLIQ